MLALRPIGAVAWGSPLQLVTIGYELRLIRDTRERYRSPTSLKNSEGFFHGRTDLMGGLGRMAAGGRQTCHGTVQ